MTSHDVVSAVRRLTGMQAVGHTGTLDPEASGLLMVCVGRATKFARFFEELDKTYWTVLRLGMRTDTQDATGMVIQQCDVPMLSRSDIQRVMSRFIGSLQQTPPMYSAVKYQGQRLHRLARRGQTVVRQPREVCIKQLDLLDSRGPWLTLKVACSKGTYIRALAEDIGLALGCGAHVTHLQRCRVGTWDVQSAYTLDAIRQQRQRGDINALLVPVAQAVDFLPAFPITAQQYSDLQTHHGKALAAILSTLQQNSLTASCYRLCTPPDHTVAILHRQASASEGWKIKRLEAVVS